MSWYTELLPGALGGFVRTATKWFAADASPTPVINDLFAELSLVDPDRLFAAGWYGAQYNPSKLVTRKGLEIYDKMRLDDQVHAALQFKKSAVLAAGWEVSPGEDDMPEDEVALFVRNTLRAVEGGFNDALFEVLSALDYGYSVSELVWAERDGDIVLAALKTRRPHTFLFDTDVHGNLLAVLQRQLRGTARMPPDKFLLFTYGKEFSNYYGRSDLEVCYRPWWSKDNAYKWLTMLLERLGIPPIFGLYDANKYTPQQVTDLKSVIKNLQAATMGIIPRPGDSASLDFWTPQLADNATRVFIPALDMYNKDISRALLMPNLIGFTPDSSTGSWARAKVHLDVFMLAVERLRTDLMEEVQESIVVPLVDLNFGPQGVYPRFRFLPVGDEAQLDLVKTWAQLVGLQVLTKQPEDELYIRKLLKLPEVDTEKLGIAPNLEENRPAHRRRDEKLMSRHVAVDYAQIEGKLNALETSARDALLTALTAVRDRALKFAARDLKPGEVADLRLQGFGDVQDALGTLLLAGYRQGHRDLRAELRGAKEYAEPLFTPTEAIRWLAAQQRQISGVLRDRLTNDVKQILLNGMKFGDTQGALQEKISALFTQYIGDDTVLEDGDPLAPYRVDTIIRTNTTNAYNQGRLIGARDPDLAGLMRGMEFSAVLDLRTTPACRLLNTKIIPMGEPQLDRLSPALHFNCRSVLVPVPVGVEIDSADFITQAEIGEALGLIPAGFK